MEQRSLPNKILLFVFPTIYLLMLISLVVFGVAYLQERPIQLFFVGVFALYILYRFVNRTRILLRELFGSDESTDESSDDGASD